MTGAPPPLVPAEVDLRDFQYMELDVRVLRDSRFAAQVSGDAFRAGVLLWCAAWHQVPAGSLPDDDIELASLAGYGRFFKEWRKVREEALMQFTLCSDGRLYHTTVCEKAMQAWESKLRHHYDRARDRLRKANKARETAKQPLLPELTFEAWNAQRMSGAVPMEKAEASAGTPQKAPAAKPGIPAENPLKGNGEGTEKERNGEGDFRDSVPDGTGAAAPPASPTPAPSPANTSQPADADTQPDNADTIFALGIPLLTAAGVTDRNGRSMLGLMRKTHGDAAVIAALGRCADEKPLQPVAWLQAALKPKTAGKHAGFDAKDYRAGVTEDGRIA